jgi:hypothetical protein
MLRPAISMPAISVVAMMCLFTIAAANSKTLKPSEPVSVGSSITLDDIDALQQAVIDAWTEMPLTVRRVIFVTEKSPILGAYSERPTNVFKAGEKLLTYIEPVGYTWTKQGKMFNFGAIVDFVVKSADGKVLGGQENFAKLSLASRTKLQEFMLNLTMSLDGIGPGKYVLEYKLHDLGSEKTVVVDQPFEIAG